MDPSDSVLVRLDHIAIAVPRIAELAPFMAGVLGARPHIGAKSRGYIFCHWTFMEGARLELLEPAGPPDGFLHRFIHQHGPRIHHVTFKVPDIHAAAERARGAGFDVVAFSDENPGWKEFFLHPKQAQGIVVQFAETCPDLDTQPLWGPSAPEFGTFPDDPPPPVTVVGLRMAAREERACRILWEEVALGEGREEEDRVVFRWPDSPMSIAAAIDPETDRVGPVGIELRDAEAREVPSGPHPLLGTRFLRPRPD